MNFDIYLLWIVTLWAKGDSFCSIVFANTVGVMWLAGASISCLARFCPSPYRMPFFHAESTLLRNKTEMNLQERRLSARFISMSVRCALGVWLYYKSCNKFPKKLNTWIVKNLFCIPPMWLGRDTNFLLGLQLIILKKPEHSALCCWLPVSTSVHLDMSYLQILELPASRCTNTGKHIRNILNSAFKSMFSLSKTCIVKIWTQNMLWSQY